MGCERVAPFGHEADAAKDNELGIDVTRAYCQLEGITDGVGDGLHLGHLVIVRGYEGALLCLEATDLVP